MCHTQPQGQILRPPVRGRVSCLHTAQQTCAELVGHRDAGVPASAEGPNRPCGCWGEPDPKEAKRAQTGSTSNVVIVVPAWYVGFALGCHTFRRQASHQMALKSQRPQYISHILVASYIPENSVCSHNHRHSLRPNKLECVGTQM